MSKTVPGAARFGNRHRSPDRPAIDLLGATTGRRTVDRVRATVATRLLVGYATVTLFGAAALWVLPTTRTGGMTPIDAVFTSASAVTLTGLSTVPAVDMGAVGEVVLFVLMVFGAVGVAGLTAGVVLAARRGGWSDRQMLAADLGSARNEHLGLLRFVLVLLAACTAVGAVGFALAGLAPFDAVFHAVSAFANGGFSTLDGGIVTAGAGGVLVACALVIVGGLGYPVTFELFQRARGRRLRLSLTSRVVLIGSVVLTVCALVGYGLVEWSNPATLGALEPADRWSSLTSLAVMPRSAGLNAVDLTGLSGPGYLLTLVLMFVGAGPAATAGGIKITGAAVLVLTVWSLARGADRVATRRTSIARTSVALAAAVTAVLATTILVTAMVLAYTGLDVETALFDATSAVTTTGLSVRTVPLASPAKLVLTVAMLVGRLAPMYLAARMLAARTPDLVPPEQHPLIT